MYKRKMNKTNSDYWIKKLNLAPHPEGGYFKETYRNEKIFNDRNLTTSIYFLLKGNDVSKFHQLKSDEIWYFNYGSSINIYLIDQEGKLEIKKLGNNIDKDEELSVIIKAGIIFAAEVINKNRFSVVSCIVVPGFSFEDFKLFKKEELINKFPHYEELIKKFS